MDALPLLKGKAVVITGAGSGLGRAYAVAAATEGARVLVNDVDAQGLAATVNLIRSAGGEAEASLVRVGTRDTAQELVAACVASFGALDGFVANAAVLNPGRARSQSPAVVEQALHTNVQGVWHCCVAAMDAMVTSGAGSIVTIVSGAMAGLSDLALYGTTKSAVLGLTYGLALELEGSGVRINAVSPLANTPMSDNMNIDVAAKGPQAHTVAPVVVHLLSDRSRGFSGQVVRFDGRSLGLVVPPRLAVVTPPRDSWSADDIADALNGSLADSKIPVGLLASSPPIEVAGGPH